jgi:flagellar biogenesis protein FliO
MNIFLVIGINILFIYTLRKLTIFDRFFKRRYSIENIDQTFLDHYTGCLLVVEHQNTIMNLPQYIKLYEKVKELGHDTVKLVTVNMNNTKSEKMTKSLGIKCIPCIIHTDCSNKQYYIQSIAEIIGIGEE